MATASRSEKQFIDTYLELASLSTQESNDKFYTTADYNKLSSLGPSLPKYKYDFPEFSNTTIDDQIKVEYLLKFKSIKPPFKFTTDITIDSNDSIYKVKSLLIDHLPQLKNENITPNDVKLLYKSKVVQDSISIDSLGTNEISFNCMITPSIKPIQKEIVEDEDPDVSEPITSSITDSSWNKIYEIIKSDLQDEEKSRDLISKFKQQI